MSIKEEALKLHAQWKGKIEVISKVSVKTAYDLSLAYTPGVAEPCMAISRNSEEVYAYTGKGNMVAVITDGTAVLGLGDIGPLAALPVMEGKALLFKEFAGVDAFPICLASKDVDTIVETIKTIAPGFGGINLEDISSPRCVEIERRLKKELDIPVFHDDQHGTAIVVASALINSLKIVGKEFKNITVALNGAGSAGAAITRMLLNLGTFNLIACDKSGIINRDEVYENWVHAELAQITNRDNKKGTLAEAMEGADVFIGVSKKDAVTQAMIRSMAPEAIVFVLANPDPEIMPDLAKRAGARIIGTGRSDFPNQINNVLAFPGIFRGALDARATDINEAMKIAAAEALASLVEPSELSEEYIIVTPFDPRVGKTIADAVKKAAVDSGIARI